MARAAHRCAMRTYRFTPYFDHKVLAKRPYLQRASCVAVVERPVRSERQPDGRWRFWGVAPELNGKYLRVVTLPDRLTIHNAFPDRRFRP